MKVVVLIVLLAVIAVGALSMYRRSVVDRAKESVYAELKRLPPVSKDFSTPEGAILCLEDAYRRKDMDAAIAAKDFKTEARLMLERTRFKEHLDEEMVAKTSEALIASFRAHTSARCPDFDGLESFFLKREPHSEKVVIVTEECRFPDGLYSRQGILVAESAQGWRVLNPVSK